MSHVAAYGPTGQINITSVIAIASSLTSLVDVGVASRLRPYPGDPVHEYVVSKVKMDANVSALQSGMRPATHCTRGPL